MNDPYASHEYGNGPQRKPKPYLAPALRKSVTWLIRFGVVALHFGWRLIGVHVSPGRIKLPDGTEIDL